MSKINELFNQKLIVMNMGLKSFHEDLQKQNIKSVHIDWRLPARGNKRMASLLSKLNR